MTKLPNLFRSEDDVRAARYYYERFLTRLFVVKRYKRMIETCREIHRYARRISITEERGESQNAGVFTYWFDLQANNLLHDFDSAWRALRAWEKAVMHKPLNLKTYRWKPTDFTQLIYYYAPLLYLRGNYQLGRKLLEAALRMASIQPGWSYEMLAHIHKTDRPSTIYDVSLFAFYSALELDLTEWPLWKKFVDDLHPKLLRISRISRIDLKEDAGLLAPLREAINNERRARLFSGTTHGLKDLTDSPSQVRKRQAGVQKKIQELDTDPRLSDIERKIQSMFLELAKLPPPGRRQSK